MNRAAVEQLRCRSAFKLIELDDKYHFIKRRSIVVRANCYHIWIPMN